MPLKRALEDFSDDDYSPESDAELSPSPPLKRSRIEAKAPKCSFRYADPWAIFKVLDGFPACSSPSEQKRLKRLAKSGKGVELKGQTRYVDGQLQYRDESQDGSLKDWTDAVYHEDLREQFLDEDSRLGTWRIAPKQGEAELDKTSFVPEQSQWGPDRLGDIVDHAGRRVFTEQAILSDAPGLYEQYGSWFHSGKCVLDDKSQPLRDIPGLNRTFSTEVEGWHLDAIRKLIPNANWTDFRARMPSWRIKGKGKKEVVRTGGISCFSNRPWRFRKLNNLDCWGLRGGRHRGPRVKKDKLAGPKPKTTTKDQKRQQGRSSANAFSQSHGEAQSFEVQPFEASPFDASRLSQKVFHGRRAYDLLGEDYHEPLSESETAGASFQRREPAFFDLPSHNSELYQYSLEREATRFGLPQDLITLVPLFVSKEDQKQARLQGRHLNDPWAVFHEIGRNPKLVNGVYIVLRHIAFPRDPKRPNVAQLSEHERLCIGQWARFPRRDNTLVNDRILDTLLATEGTNMDVLSPAYGYHLDAESSGSESEREL